MDQSCLVFLMDGQSVGHRFPQERKMTNEMSLWT